MAAGLVTVLAAQTQTTFYAAFADAQIRPGNAFKPELGRRTLVRALLQAATMEV